MASMVPRRMMYLALFGLRIRVFWLKTIILCFILNISFQGGGSVEVSMSALEIVGIRLLVCEKKGCE